MADAQYRLSQATGQQFYSQYNNSRHLQRPTSPHTSHRRGFPSDTPSPSRSPRARSPSNHPYSMYSQNHAGINSHGMMNGGGHQRFGGQLNMNKQYTQHNPHQHNQHAHGGQDSAHGAHQGNFISHQHNQSGGAAAHFGAPHLQNGAQNGGYSNPTQAQTEHWKKQLEVAEQVRNLQHAHPHARNASSASKVQLPGSSAGGPRENDKADGRYRTQGDWSDEEEEKSPWTEIDMGGSNLRCISLALFDYYPFLTKLFLNNNRLQSIPPGIGKLKALTHLDLSLNQISVLPPEMGMLVNLRTLLLVDNKIEIIPFELGNLFALDMLAVDGNNTLNKTQLDIIVQDGPQELIKQLRENAPGPDPPEPRDWVVLDESESATDEKFQVLSFNILANFAATSTMFGYTPSRALDWDYRKELILEEIRQRDADIVCLQELDSHNYHNLFRETLARCGYKGVYYPRGRSRTMSAEQLKQVDGCATFIKDSKYVVLDKQVIDYPQASLARPDMKGQHDVYNRVMTRDNIAVVAFLENRDTGSRLIVVNTHLYWDPQYRDVKVVQATLLVEEVQKLAEKYAKHPPTPDKDKIRFRFADIDKEGDDTVEEVAREPVPSMSYNSAAEIPMVICGDFNSKPESGVHELLTTGNLAANHKDLGTFKYGDISKHGVHHPFSLKSSYGNIGELPFTNYTPPFTGVLDYIFYTTNALTCTGLLGEVDKEYLTRVPGFPNVHYPSDHLLLMSEFKAKPRKERKVTEVDFGPQKENRRN